MAMLQNFKKIYKKTIRGTQDLKIDKTHRGRLADCFQQIIKNQSSAKDAIKTASGDNNVEVFSPFGFQFLRNEDWTEFCECWFEFEYFDFVQERRINDLMLQQVLENIRNGYCPHVKANLDIREIQLHTGECDGSVKPFTSYTTLYHAAAAADNTECLKYLLLTTESSKDLDQSSCGLLPEQLAVLKNNNSTFKMIKASPYYIDISTYIDTEFANVKRNGKVYYCGNSKDNPTIFAKRSNGKVAAVKVVYYHAFVTNMIKIGETPSDELIDSLFQNTYVCIAGLVRDPITHLLFYGHNDRVIQILKNKSIKNGQLHIKALLVACILNDAEDVLGLIFERKIDAKKELYDYNLMDMAIVFGREKCLSHKKLKSKVKPRKVWKTKSPFTFIIDYIADTSYWDSNTIEFLFSLCQGHDVNHQDKNKMTPLHHVIKTYNPLITQKLFDLGADINIKDKKGRTPLIAFLDQVGGYRGPPRAILKEFLFRNPVTDSSFKMENALRLDLNNTLLTDISNAHKIAVRNGPNVRYSKGEVTKERVEIIMSETERVVTTSFSALLYEFGFRMTKDAMRMLDNFTMDDIYCLNNLSCINNQSFISTHFKEVLSHPRSLKTVCRLAIRRQYPGTRLHKMLTHIHFPEQMKDYILCTDLLQFVEYEKDAFFGEKRWHHVDAQPFKFDEGMAILMEKQ